MPEFVQVPAGQTVEGEVSPVKESPARPSAAENVAPESPPASPTEEVEAPQTSNLRSRHKSSSQPAKKISPEEQTALQKKRLGQLHATVDAFPGFKMAKPHLDAHGEKVAQFIVMFELQFVPALWGFFSYLVTVSERLVPIFQGDNCQDLASAVFGLVLCIFGGTFPLVIASVEAFRLVGYQGVLDSSKDLYAEVNSLQCRDYDL